MTLLTFLSGVLYLLFIALVFVLIDKLRILLRRIVLDALELYFRYLQMDLDHNQRALSLKTEENEAILVLRNHRQQLTGLDYPELLTTANGSEYQQLTKVAKTERGG